MKTSIIAEIGNTHEGSVGLAKCFIKAAAECGVDAVKFQTHIFDAESLPNAPQPPYFNEESRKDYFERTAFNLEQHIVLKACAEDHGVEFISSPFSCEAVEMLERVGVKTYKVPSGEVTNIPLLEGIGATGKPVLLSSGMSSWAELDAAVRALQDSRSGGVTLLQCSSIYPCPADKVGLNVLDEMRSRYELPVGLSDHTMGFYASLAAVANGATVVERHFTLSRKMYGSDARHSLEPGELRQLVDEMRDLESAMQHPVDKDQVACQLAQMKTTFEKSIVACENIKEGSRITRAMLAFKKPGDGLPPARCRDILGKAAARDIRANEKLTEKDFL